MKKMLVFMVVIIQSFFAYSYDSYLTKYQKFSQAVQNDNAFTVKELLPDMDVESLIEGYVNATFKGNQNIADLILKDPRVQESNKDQESDNFNKKVGTILGEGLKLYAQEVSGPKKIEAERLIGNIIKSPLLQYIPKKDLDLFLTQDVLSDFKARIRAKREDVISREEEQRQMMEKQAEERKKQEEEQRERMREESRKQERERDAQARETSKIREIGL